MCHQEHSTRTASEATTGVVVLAAGSGERLGLGVKALVSLAGRSLLEWSLLAAAANRDVAEVVVTAPSGVVDRMRRIVDDLGLGMPVRIVIGGRTRQQSAGIGIRALSHALRWAAVTDAARPLMRAGFIDELVRILAEQDMPGAAPRAGRPAVGAVPALPPPDTIHAVDGGRLDETFDRSLLRAAQTPQVFCRRCLIDAYQDAERNGFEATDDAAIVNRHGGTVLLVAGDVENFKITTPVDLATAEAIVSGPRTNNATPMERVVAQ